MVHASKSSLLLSLQSVKKVTCTCNKKKKTVNMDIDLGIDVLFVIFFNVMDFQNTTVPLGP